MILLERLAIRELGALHRVELEFQPQGHHLITVADSQAQVVREALMTCLFGPADGLRARSDGAMVECVLAAGGRPVTVRRTLRATGGDESELIVNRGPRSTPIRGGAQVGAALDAMVGLDQETLQRWCCRGPAPNCPRPPRFGRCCAACWASAESRRWKPSSPTAPLTGKKKRRQEPASSWPRR